MPHKRHRNKKGGRQSRRARDPERTSVSESNPVASGTTLQQEEPAEASGGKIRRMSPQSQQGAEAPTDTSATLGASVERAQETQGQPFQFQDAPTDTSATPGTSDERAQETQGQPFQFQDAPIDTSGTPVTSVQRAQEEWERILGSISESSENSVESLSERSEHSVECLSERSEHSVERTHQALGQPSQNQAWGQPAQGPSETSDGGQRPHWTCELFKATDTACQSHQGGQVPTMSQPFASGTLLHTTRSQETYFPAYSSDTLTRQEASSQVDDIPRINTETTAGGTLSSAPRPLQATEVPPCNQSSENSSGARHQTQPPTEGSQNAGEGTLEGSPQDTEIPKQRPKTSSEGTKQVKPAQSLMESSEASDDKTQAEDIPTDTSDPAQPEELNDAFVQVKDTVGCSGGNTSSLAEDASAERTHLTWVRFLRGKDVPTETSDPDELHDPYFQVVDTVGCTIGSAPGPDQGTPQDHTEAPSDSGGAENVGTTETEPLRDTSVSPGHPGHAGPQETGEDFSQAPQPVSSRTETIESPKDEVGH